MIVIRIIKFYDSFPNEYCNKKVPRTIDETTSMNKSSNVETDFSKDLFFLRMNILKRKASSRYVHSIGEINFNNLLNGDNKMKTRKSYYVIWRQGGRNRYYWVRTLAYSSMEQANEARNKTKKMGYSAYIVDADKVNEKGLPTTYNYPTNLYN